jgi:hypothetical protein
MFNGNLREEDVTYDGMIETVWTVHGDSMDGTKEKKHASSFLDVEAVHKKATAIIICEHTIQFNARTTCVTRNIKTFNHYNMW